MSKDLPRDKWEKAVEKKADAKNSFIIEEENSIIGFEYRELL